MEEKQLNADESLALIGRMIENTRNRMVRNAGRPFLIWGYTTVLVTAAIAIALRQTGDGRYNWLWLAIPLVSWVSMHLTQHRNIPTQGKAHTFVDRVLGIVWAVMGAAAFFVSMLTLFDLFRMPILFIVILMMASGTAITGLVIRFAPVTVGGIIGILLAPILLIVTDYWIFALFALAFVVMMIIPGHIFNCKSKRERCSDH